MPEEKAFYEEVIDKVPDKDILECREESAILLAVCKCEDTVNYNDKFFHVDKNARSIWENVSKKINKI